MDDRRLPVRLALAILATSLLITPTWGQKLARKYFEENRYGFSFKPLEDAQAIPPQPEAEKRGAIARISCKKLLLNYEGRTYSMDADITVWRLPDLAVSSGDKSEDDEGSARQELGELLEKIYIGLDADAYTIDEPKKIKKIEARHRRWEWDLPGTQIPIIMDVWSFPLEDADIHLAYFFPGEDEKKWGKAAERSAKTFKEIERTASAESVGKNASYAELLAFHEEDAQRIEGWRALPTPSEKFIIKTSATNQRFLDEVIERLERSRELYERDFPPSKDFDHVSIVRVCGTEEEFHKYGGTSGGVAGWFNPKSTELVIYDAVNINRNMTYAVMSHEAFHQYCHFLFEESEAHRWFDEGHGDYYGAAEFKGRKVEINTKMPAGLNRLDEIKKMLREETYAPVEKHLNFNHREWQTQGPSNVSCYAQSWSIVYMLRQGMLGNVSSKYWKPEYAEIIPAYVETLHSGYKEAYAEILAERKKEREEEADGQSAPLVKEKVNRFDLDDDQKEEIWKASMKASWGQIDFDQFQEDWLRFIDDEL